VPWRLEEFTAHLRDERNLSPHTLRAYEREVAQFSEFARSEMGCRDPRGVSPNVVRAYLAHLHSRRLARVSTQRALAALRTYFRFLGREGVVDANPAKVVPTPRAPRKLPEMVTAPQLAEILEALPATPAGRRDRAALELLYAAGVRAGELVGLDLDDVDLSRRLARVRGKGGRERLVPFGPRAGAALGLYLEVRVAKFPAAGDALFLNGRGQGPITRSGFGWRLGVAARRAGISGRPVLWARVTAPHPKELTSTAPASRRSVDAPESAISGPIHARRTWSEKRTRSKARGATASTITRVERK